MGVYPQKKARFYTYICRNMTHFRQSSKLQLPAYQYAYGDKTTSGVCMQSASDYSPFGVLLDGRSMQKMGYRYSFQGQEHDDEVKGEGNSVNYKYRMHDPRVGRIISVDPLAAKFAGWSPYAFCMNNPIMLIDPDGQEPIKPQAGTVSVFMAIFNNTPSKMGTLKGKQASQALERLGATEFNWEKMSPLPTTTPYFNNKDGRYIYTHEGGWIDMVHFLFYAGKAYSYKVDKENAQKALDEIKNEHIMFPVPGCLTPLMEDASLDPEGEAIQDGYQQEAADAIWAPHSAYSYEDLPSDRFGADFGANYFNPNSKLSLGEQLTNYFYDRLDATCPQNAPNYEKLPSKEPTDKPSKTNKTTNPAKF